jgi:hypothetical protein
MRRNGNGNGNGMPPADAVWLALGIVIWAMARALGERRRALFIDALEALASDINALRRIIAPLGERHHLTQMPQAQRIAGEWLRRIVVQLRAARQ